ncbi:hypothetical protein EMIT0210MI2_12645 [Priestia megaterium]
MNFSRKQKMRIKPTSAITKKLTLNKLMVITFVHTPFAPETIITYFSLSSFFL